MSALPTNPPSTFLLRIAEVFDHFAPDILEDLGVVPVTRLGNEYHLVKTTGPRRLEDSAASLFVRWKLPVQHAWPCCPREMDGFVEKAAQAIFRKFGGAHPQVLLVGQLDSGSPDPYYKKLASNLRGRVLQLFPAFPVLDAEAQDPDRETLFCMVGKEGLFCGMRSPKLANGLYPGGTRFIRLKSPGTISRAGAKIAEALHYLRMFRPPPAEKSRWLELGASPGGMTSELLAKGYQVTAVDRAPLDPRLGGREGLDFILADVSTFQPAEGATYHAILCDMNGDPMDSFRQVVRLAPRLEAGGLVVFTLKTLGIGSFSEATGLFAKVVEAASAGGFDLLARTHLTYNRLEFTLFFTRLP